MLCKKTRVLPISHHVMLDETLNLGVGSRRIVKVDKVRLVVSESRCVCAEWTSNGIEVIES